VERFFLNLKDVKGALPLPEAEPSADQIAAIKTRVVDLKMTPYADFALFTPYNMRFLKALKFKNFVLQPDGTFKSIEVPGPPNYESWYASWRVYENVLLMLRVEDPSGNEVMVVSPSALEMYREAFRELVVTYSEVWHLLVVAEDRCRAEHFSRLRRTREIQHLAGQAPDFRPYAPWDDIFRQASLDRAYWDRHVREPALIFMARGVKKKQPGGSGAVTEGITDKIEVKKKAKKKDRVARLKNEIQQLKNSQGPGQTRATSAPSRGGKNGGGKGGAHPRKDGSGRFVTDREGKPLCFAFSNGNCRGVCPQGRMHLCQQCLGSHCAKDCPKAKEGQRM
jgi:hypothetical protein